MKSKRLTRGRRDKHSLRMFCSGPGIGESIVLQLPCGGWGVVDCWGRDSCATLEFLQLHKVERLLFYCQTHPHHDHFSGAHKLLRHFQGKIDNLWRFPGFTPRDFMKWILSAKTAARYRGDTQADAHADAYIELLKCFDREKKHLKDENYRRVAAPHKGLLTNWRFNYSVNALAPTAKTLDQVEKAMAKIIVKRGKNVLDDASGKVLNSASIVLLIQFSRAKVLLLADAQGAEASPHPQPCSVIKIAHHGSDNGFGAEPLTALPSTNLRAFALITPFISCRLPRDNMVIRYKKAFKLLLQTNENLQLPRLVVPTLRNPRVTATACVWVGIEVFPTGRVRQIPASQSMSGKL